VCFITVLFCCLEFKKIIEIGLSGFEAILQKL
jgi:hypothetical protein